MAALPNKRWTAEEYLAFERASPEKHEFVGGEVYLMTRASRKHNLIAVNVSTSLNNQLRKRPCEVYANDMRVRILQQDYVYPDVVVVCGDPQIEDDQGDTLLNPTLIVEVLSPSTAQYDRGDKLHSYIALASLQEYVLISQDMARIERYRRRDDGQWLYADATALDAILELTSIEAKLALADVYDKVVFEEQSTG